MPHWPSEALVWEMQQLQSGGHLCKTFVVMPPSYLFRPGALAQPALFDRLFDRLRYITRETLEAMAPDYFVETRHTVALEAERAEFARAGWESARAIASKIGLELPDYDPKGAVFLAAALVPPPIGATASVLDSYRITALVGALDWKSDTTGSLLLSVARGR